MALERGRDVRTDITDAEPGVRAQPSRRPQGPPPM